MAVTDLTEISQKDIDRFWSHVDKTGKCWPWTKGHDKDGYGKFSLFIGKKKIHLRAHRVAYFLSYGSIPDGQLICHTCDNPPCCRDEHLFPGTPPTNNADRNIKNRQAKGHIAGRPRDKSHNTLMPTDILEIKKLITASIPISQIAHKFNVRHSTIWHIAKGNTWRWVIASLK